MSAARVVVCRQVILLLFVRHCILAAFFVIHKVIRDVSCLSLTNALSVDHETKCAVIPQHQRFLQQLRKRFNGALHSEDASIRTCLTPFFDHVLERHTTCSRCTAGEGCHRRSFFGECRVVGHKRLTVFARRQAQNAFFRLEVRAELHLKLSAAQVPEKHMIVPDARNE